MRIDVIMPQMGESIQEGTIVKWLKKIGETIGRDEPLFEISTDKVDAEIPSPAAGVLAEINVKEGETVAIKTVVGVIETEAAKGAAAPAAGAEGAAPKQPAAATPPPAAAAPPPASGAPAKASPAPAGVAGGGSAPAWAQGGPGTGGGGRDSGDGGGQAAAGSGGRETGAGGAPPGSQKGTAVLEERVRTKSSPVVRKIAADHGVDIAGLTGTGIMGRVTKNDILGYLETRPAAPAAAPGGAPAAAAPAADMAKAYPAFQPGERFERVPMTPMRRKIAEHMVTSKRISAHVSTWFEIDMSRVAQVRAAKKGQFQERHGVNLSFMPFIMKCTVDSLLAYPALNASIEGTDVLYKKDINLGIAVALDWGLIVPVVKNAQDLSLSGLAKGMNDLADRARKKQLKPDEVQGGTFTITNPGIFGSLMGTPIINQPQVAILGVGTIEKRPVVIDDAIAIRTMAYFSISFDHRLIDGAMADQFMAHLKKLLQEFDAASV